MVQPGQGHQFSRSAVEPGGREDTFYPWHKMKVWPIGVGGRSLCQTLYCPQMALGTMSGHFLTVHNACGYCWHLVSRVQEH